MADQLFHSFNRRRGDVSMDEAEEDSQHSEEDSVDRSSSLSSDNNQWRFPTTQQIREEINNLPQQDPCRLAWESLLTSAIANDKDTPEWSPFNNGLCFMLFLLRYHPTLAVTRETMDNFLLILLTLQQQGIIDDEYYIPKCATTIEKWWCFIPKPPTSMFYFCKWFEE